MIELITSIDDPRISAYRAMTDMDARLRRESTEGFYMAEGATVIARALAARHSVVSTLCREKWLSSLVDLGIPESVPMYVGDDDLLREITGFHVHRGALAVFRRPAPLDVPTLIDGARMILILEDLVDHANVGAAFRSGAGLGVGGVLLSPRCADPLYRRAIKTSMGATLGLPFARAATWPEALSMLAADGFEVWGMTPRESAVTLSVALAHEPRRVALAVGTEGTGLSEGALSACTRHVRIPMRNDIDSLNVAAASAVAMYAVASALRPEVD